MLNCKTNYLLSLLGSLHIFRSLSLDVRKSSSEVQIISEKFESSDTLSSQMDQDVWYG